MDCASSELVPIISGVAERSVLEPLLFLVYMNCVSSLALSSGSRITMYADDILLFKPVNGPEDYTSLQEDIDALFECVSTCHLTMNSSKCKYLAASKKPTSFHCVDFIWVIVHWNRFIAIAT